MVGPRRARHPTRGSRARPTSAPPRSPHPPGPGIGGYRELPGRSPPPPGHRRSTGRPRRQPRHARGRHGRPVPLLVLRRSRPSARSATASSASATRATGGGVGLDRRGGDSTACFRPSRHLRSDLVFGDLDPAQVEHDLFELLIGEGDHRHHAPHAGITPLRPKLRVWRISSLAEPASGTVLRAGAFQLTWGHEVAGLVGDGRAHRATRALTTVALPRTAHPRCRSPRPGCRRCERCRRCGPPLGPGSPSQ